MYWISTDEEMSGEEMQKIADAVAKILDSEDVIFTQRNIRPMSKEERRDYVAELIASIDVSDDVDEPYPILGKTEVK